MDNQKVYIIDDNLDMCMALNNLFQAAKIESAFYNDSKSFLKEYKSTWRGCILVDMLMPDMDGLGLISLLKQNNNQMPIIMITGYNNVPIAVRSMQMGASDILIKPFDANYLLDKVKALMKKSNTEFQQHEDILLRLATLTTREREVMELIVSGKLNKQIADILNITIKTVEVHRSRIMSKLKIKNVTELVKLRLLTPHSNTHNVDIE